MLVSQRLATICALDTTHRIHCLGAQMAPAASLYGPMRQAPSELTPLNLGPANPRRPYAQIASGAQHSCALTAITDAQPIAAVYCWGSNTRDQLGTGLSDTNDPSVVTIPDEAVDNPVVSVHAGAHHSCARRQQGQVYCWGQNTLGALGLGGTIGSAQVAQCPRLFQAAAPHSSPNDSGQGMASCAQVTVNGPPEAQRFVCWGVEPLVHPDARAGAYLPNLAKAPLR